MDSESAPPSRRRSAVGRWSDLPPELLPVIAAGLQNRTDIDRFRSVCRSWRFSISPPPPPQNKISPLFPHRISFCLEAEFGCHSNSEKKYLIADSVYLLSPRADPSKSWIVSVQESKAGKLLLRHALTHQEIPGSSGSSIDLSEWSVTPIAISYSFRFGHLRRRNDKVVLSEDEVCSICECAVSDAKVIFVSNSEFDSNQNSPVMALYNLGPGPKMLMCAVTIDIDGDGTSASQYVDEDEDGGEDADIEVGRMEDFVDFNGRIYAVDNEAYLYLFDSAAMRLLRMDCGNFHDLVEDESVKRFVVSDGDLYIVSQFSIDRPQVYRFVMDEIDAKRCDLEKVEDLGDRVFFIIRDASFSVSARDLPRPLRGNCVIIARGAFPLWSCSDGFTNNQEMAIFHLGDLLPQFGAYSALFTPPSMWINQLRRDDSEKKKKTKLPRVVQEIPTTP